VLAEASCIQMVLHGCTSYTGTGTDSSQYDSLSLPTKLRPSNQQCISAAHRQSWVDAWTHKGLPRTCGTWCETKFIGWKHHHRPVSTRSSGTGEIASLEEFERKIDAYCNAEWTRRISLRPTDLTIKRKRMVVACLFPCRSYSPAGLRDHLFGLSHTVTLLIL
jgi:hypothetical protein